MEEVRSMPAVRTGTTIFACAVALATSACGGAGTQTAGSGGETGGPAEGGSPTPQEVTFSTADLCDLVLTEQDVPSGLSQFRGLVEEADSCTARFATDGAPPFYISTAYLYADAEEAEEEAEARRDADADAHEGAELIESPLGEGSFGLLRQNETTTEGNTTSIEPGYVAYYWRVGNVVQALTYDQGFSGKVDEEDVQPLAETLKARAEEL